MALSVKVRNADGPGRVVRGHVKKLDVASGKAVLKAATHAGGELARQCAQQFAKGTGQLARSFLPAQFVQRSDGVAAGALSDLVYASILDQGGTILPKTAKMLAQPLTAVAKTKWPRDWPKGDLAIIKSKKGNLLLIDAHSKSIVPHYLLSKSVTIGATGYIDKAEKEARGEAAKIAEDEAAEYLTTTKGKARG